MTAFLSITDLTRRYGGLSALADVGFDVARGERVGVIGPNGAGKTTLFRLIAGAEAPSSGRLELDGVDVTGMRARRRALLGIGRTFQITELFGSLCVADNLRLAAGTRRAPGPGDEAVERFGLADLLDIPTAALGYGEQRLVELAVTFATGAKLMLLDEPAAGLGGVERERITAAVRSLPSDVTVLLIEHDIDLVLDLVQRVICLANGSLIADAPSAQIGSDPAVREVYLGVDYAQRPVGDGPPPAQRPDAGGRS